jgi:CheY-like chemotaxis protein
MKKTVLVIDDVEINIDILVALLSDEYDILVALDGMSGLEVLEEDVNVDLILLDIMMPEINGFEVCEKLKLNENTKDIPVIFSTAKTDEESIQKAFAVGGVDYITKPFKSKEVKARVRTQLLAFENKQYLEERIKEEVQKNIIQEKKLFQQSKIASMAEMMDAVAHQWMQPISTIHTSLEKLKIKKMLNNLEDKDIDQTIDTSKEQIKYLIDTLNGFRKFFRPNPTRLIVNIKKQIESVIELIQSNLMKYNINISLPTESTIEYSIVETDFKHIFINLFNNSKDAFLENKIDVDSRTISINIYQDSECVVIEYFDNAGGIKEEILDKIFNFNVTTKDNQSGTGVGLYMTKQIIEKIDGKIEAFNIENGAKFVISLPLLD